MADGHTCCASAYIKIASWSFHLHPTVQRTVSCEIDRTKRKRVEKKEKVMSTIIIRMLDKKMLFFFFFFYTAAIL